MTTATMDAKIRNTTTATTTTMTREATPSRTHIAETVTRYQSFSIDPSCLVDSSNDHFFPRIYYSGYDNTNPMYYEAMREKFNHGKFLKQL